MSSSVYVVAVDSRQSGLTSSMCGYTEQKCIADYFQKNIVEHPKMKCFSSPVAKLCGLELKVYFMKAKKGLAQYYREGGEAACMEILARNPDFVANNNGIASWLTIDPENGLPEWTITGKAYVVWDDGESPLSKGQVWGIQEMIHCSMDYYDFDRTNMREGHDYILQWSQEYRNRTFEPLSGCGGADIYSSRAD